MHCVHCYNYYENSDRNLLYHANIENNQLKTNCASPMRNKNLQNSYSI